MNIIFEGQDNTGKTTQIKLLREFYNDTMFHYLHYSALKVPDIKSYSKKLYEDMFWLLYSANMAHINLILDRAHLGEYVYGKIYRDYDADFIFQLEKDYSGYANIMGFTYLVVLIDESENLIKRDDGLSFSIDKSKKDFEKQRFIEAYQKSNIQKKILINCNDYDCDIMKIHEVVKKFIEDNK